VCGHEKTAPASASFSGLVSEASMFACSFISCCITQIIRLGKRVAFQCFSESVRSVTEGFVAIDHAAK